MEAAVIEKWQWYQLCLRVLDDFFPFEVSAHKTVQTEHYACQHCHTEVASGIIILPWTVLQSAHSVMKYPPLSSFVIWFSQWHWESWSVTSSQKTRFLSPYSTSISCLYRCITLTKWEAYFPVNFFANVCIRVWYFTHPIFLSLYWKLTACWKPHTNLGWTMLNYNAGGMAKSFGLCSRVRKQHCWIRSGNFWETQYGKKFVFDHHGSGVAHKFLLTLWEGAFLFIHLKITLFIIEYIHSNQCSLGTYSVKPRLLVCSFFLWWWWR